MNKSKLEKELRSLGAGEREAQKLTDVATALAGLKPRGLTKAAKQRLAPDPVLTKRSFLHLPRLGSTWKFALGGSFASAALLLFFAQGALPGSILYPIKRKAEEARSTVQPSYQDTLLKEREEEVQQLKQQGTVSPQVMQEAEQQYQQTAQEAVDRWQKQETPAPEPYVPKYDWSREWWRQNSLDTKVQGLTDSVLQTPKNLLPRL